MATIKLTLSSKIDKKSGKASILLRFIGGRYIDTRVSSGFFISRDRWQNEEKDERGKILKESKIIIPRLATKEQKELVQLKSNLDDLCNLIIESFTQIDKSTINKDWLVSLIDKYHFPDKYLIKEEVKHITLLEYIHSFIETAPQRKDKATGRFLTYNNIQQYKATEKHLKAFARLQNLVDFEFSQIDKTFNKNFIEYLQSEIQDIDEKRRLIFKKDGTPQLLKECFTLNSVGKHIRILKLMLNEATREGINTFTAYTQFYVFTEECDTIYLNEDELQKLKDKDFKNIPHLDHVRDWFLLLAWTGCRFSDLEKISKTDIKDGFITFRQQKTNTKVTIPLHPVVKEILEKYDYNMPEAISNQKFNEYIKVVAREAEIDGVESITKTIGGKLICESLPKYDLISSHTGRRSFCTNMYKRGLPTLMIMSISGHKTEKSFLKYIKVKQEEHATMMAEAWGKIY